MLDTQSDYALNKVDKASIVCPSVTGEHIRLTREDFASEEEFERWKNWSDDDYHKIELIGRNDDACLSFEAQWDTPAPSAEEMVLASYTAAEKEIQRRQALEQVKSRLTPKQFRRLWMFHVENLSMKEIAAIEKVSIRAIYTSFEIAKRKL